MFISPSWGSTIEFERGRITLEKRTLRDRTIRLIPRVLIEGARNKSSCPSHFLLCLFTCIEGSILRRSNEPRAGWRVTLSGGCTALPAEGWHCRVYPLERWKHVDRGWWPFFRSADLDLSIVKIFACEQRRFLAYIYRELVLSSSFAERRIRCFPVAGHNHLWRGPANNIFDIGPRQQANNLEIGQRVARVVRETGI